MPYPGPRVLVLGTSFPGLIFPGTSSSRTPDTVFSDLVISLSRYLVTSLSYTGHPILGASSSRDLVLSYAVVRASYSGPRHLVSLHLDIPYPW